MWTPAWCHWSPSLTSKQAHWEVTTHWHDHQPRPFTSLPKYLPFIAGLPLPHIFMDITYTDCLFTSRSLGHLLSGHASIHWQAPGHSHSSIFQHIPRFYRASNSLHTKSMGMLNICSSSSAIAMASCPYLQIKRHSYTLLPSWQCQRPPAWDYHWILIWGVKHCTLTWASQTHSKVHSSCINASGPYIFSLTQSLISWPSCMICWY